MLPTLILYARYLSLLRGSGNNKYKINHLGDLVIRVSEGNIGHMDFTYFCDN